MDNDELAKKEDDIQLGKKGEGPLTERVECLSQHDVYRESTNVFLAYVELAEAGDLEATKRALFYTWYQMSEPNPSSGIPVLDDVPVFKILTIVNQIAKEDLLDKELKYMLPYYYAVACFYFERFDGLDDLLVASVRNESRYAYRAKVYDYTNRGQMGYYWRSIKGEFMS